MKRWFIIFIVLLFCIGVADAKPTKKVGGDQKASQTQASSAKEEPYKSYIVMEAITGKVIEGDNIHLKRPPASVVKLMVALVVMEKVAKGEVKLTDQVAVTREASKIGGSQVYLKEGETFSRGGINEGDIDCLGE